jgi:hypothetical protein
MARLIDMLQWAIRGHRDPPSGAGSFERAEPCHFDGLQRRRWARPTASGAADARAMRLLIENLTHAQRDQYEKHEYFEVVGGETGRRYRIRRGVQANIEQIDDEGRLERRICFMPDGELVVGDVMLAQKLALELFELQVLAVANAFPPFDRVSLFNWFL